VNSVTSVNSCITTPPRGVATQAPAEEEVVQRPAGVHQGVPRVHRAHAGEPQEQDHGVRVGAPPRASL
jgi:hypothetical protein